MNRCAIICIVISLFLMQNVFAVVYECTYKTKDGYEVVSSFNPFHKHKKNYTTLYMAYKTGNCRELYIKKYFLDATSCNIQFYKHNMKIAGLTCAKNKESAMKKLKEIARRDFGYISK